jgi:hypothetical protein
LGKREKETERERERKIEKEREREERKTDQLEEKSIHSPPSSPQGSLPVFMFVFGEIFTTGLNGITLRN